MDTLLEGCNVFNTEQYIPQWESGGGITIYLYIFSGTSIGTSTAIGGKIHSGLNREVLGAERISPWLQPRDKPRSLPVHRNSDVWRSSWRKRRLAMWELCEEHSRQRGWSGQSLLVGVWLGAGRSPERLKMAKDTEGRARRSRIWTLIPCIKSLPAGNHWDDLPVLCY